MFYHANTCKQCSDVLHVGLGHAGILCRLPLCSLCLPYLCSGRVPYVLAYDCDVFRKFPVRVLNVTTFMCYFFFMRCVDLTLLGKCFQFKPQPKQPNWSLIAVINSCCGCHFWLKMCGKFRAPTLPGTPHTFSIFSLSLAVWKMAPRFHPD